MFVCLLLGHIWWYSGAVPDSVFRITTDRLREQYGILGLNLSWPCAGQMPHPLSYLSELDISNCYGPLIFSEFAGPIIAPFVLADMGVYGKEQDLNKGKGL